MGKNLGPAREGPIGFRGAYSVELLYSDSPTLDAEQLAARVRSRCPAAEAATADGHPPILFAHRDHVVTFHADDVEAPVSAKTVVLPGDDVVDVGA